MANHLDRKSKPMIRKAKLAAEKNILMVRILLCSSADSSGRIDKRYYYSKKNDTTSILVWFHRDRNKDLEGAGVSHCTSTLQKITCKIDT